MEGGVAAVGVLAGLEFGVCGGIGLTELVEKRCIELNLTAQCFLGEKFTSKKLQSQVNQVYARMAVLNKSTALGRLQSKVVL